MTLMIITGLIIMGLAFGSFINALVWRIYQQSLPSKKRAAKLKELSISKGRSMCPHCKHTLTALDLIPVLSWLSLGGKCRYCKKSISVQYPFIELLTAALFVTSYAFWPTELVSSSDVGVFTLWLTFLVGLVALAVYDIKWMLLPNRIVFPLIVLASAKVLLLALTTDASSVILASIGGMAIAGGIFYILFQISDGAWIGGGDVKLGFALGLMIGDPISSFLMLFLASLFGLLVALPDIFRNQSLRRRIPFGPALILATYVCVLWGGQVIDWYANTYLFI